MMRHANRGELPLDLREQLESCMTSQVTAQGGANHLNAGTYSIITAYLVPVRGPSHETGYKREAGHTGSFQTFVHSYFIARFLLQNGEGKLSTLNYPADEYTSEVLKDLTGKKIISDGSTFVIEGSRCHVADMQVRSDDCQNYISPMYSASAIKREDLFTSLGMLRQSALRPGVQYEIIDTLVSTAADPMSNVLRGVINVKIREARREVLGSETRLADDDLITVRVYFNNWEEPQMARACRFFRNKIAHKFVPKGAISTINSPKRLNQFLANFVGPTDEPIMKVGEVYVLDAIYEREKSDSPAFFIVFHSIDSDEEVEKSDKHTLCRPGVRMFKVNCFGGRSARSSGTSPTNAEGRRMSDVHTFFANATKNSGNNKCAFSVAEDIYDGMLDYAYFGNAVHGVELIKMETIDIHDPDAVTALSRDSFARGYARGKLLSADTRIRVD